MPRFAICKTMTQSFEIIMFCLHTELDKYVSEEYENCLRLRNFVLISNGNK